MANQYVNKLIKDGVTKFDLTNDTVTPETLAEGVTAHDASGKRIVGSMQGVDDNILYGVVRSKDQSTILQEVIIYSNNVRDALRGDYSGYTRPGRWLETVTIAPTVTALPYYMLYGCSKITTIAIPNSVTSIGRGAFGKCDSLQTITINKPQDSISGAPWGATNATVVWTG